MSCQKKTRVHLIPICLVARSIVLDDLPLNSKVSTSLKISKMIRFILRCALHIAQCTMDIANCTMDIAHCTMDIHDGLFFFSDLFGHCTLHSSKVSKSLKICKTIRFIEQCIQLLCMSVRMFITLTVTRFIPKILAH